MKTSDNGKNLIKHFEGLRLNAYKCSSGVPTIGYGHTAFVKENDKITIGMAELFLEQDLARYEYVINKYCKVSLNQNQFDALISFVFNVGEKNFINSTLLKLLNQKKYNEVANQFERWIFDNNRRPLEGLKRRRKAEKELFLLNL